MQKKIILFQKSRKQKPMNGKTLTNKSEKISQLQMNYTHTYIHINLENIDTPNKNKTFIYDLYNDNNKEK